MGVMNRIFSYKFIKLRLRFKDIYYYEVLKKVAREKAMLERKLVPAEKRIPGRNLGKVNNTENEFKFLKEQLNGEYYWPKSEDLACVDKVFVCFGPIKLIGNGPFRVISI